MTLRHDYSGAQYYLYEADVAGHTLVVALSCFVEDLPDHEYGLLDTGSAVCVLPSSLVAALGSAPVPGAARVVLASRFGRFEGWMDRFRLTLHAQVGSPLEIDATWFVCPDWPGPLVLGWRGCLDRMRFAMDPSEDAFYFGPL